MVPTAQQQLIDRSGQADLKASIVMTTSAILTSVAAARLGVGEQELAHLDVDAELFACGPNGGAPRRLTVHHASSRGLGS